MSQHLYAYGVVRQEDIELDVEGVAGATSVYTVDYKSLSAIVSPIDTTDVEQSDANVEAHNGVLQTVLEYDGGRTVVPMGFGMAFKNARTLKGVIRGARRAFRKALNEVDGTVELGVKLVAMDDTDEDPATIREDVGALLAEHSINETEDDLFSDRLVLNRSYLVDREDRAGFDRAIDEVEADYPDLTVQYTGPWAPYNFVDIQIGAERGT